MVSRAHVNSRCPYSRARRLSCRQGAGVCWLVVAVRIEERVSAQRSFHQELLVDWVITRVCGRGQDFWRSVQRPASSCVLWGLVEAGPCVWLVVGGMFGLVIIRRHLSH